MMSTARLLFEREKKAKASYLDNLSSSINREIFFLQAAMINEKTMFILR